MQYKKSNIGGWFQRTTLHMTEIWDFLKYLKSGAGFSQKTWPKPAIASISPLCPAILGPGVYFSGN